MLIILFVVLHFNFLFVLCGRLSWLLVSFLLQVKHTLSYRIVSYPPIDYSGLCFSSARRRHHVSRKGVTQTSVEMQLQLCPDWILEEVLQIL